jgi:hypothetical protein
MGLPSEGAVVTDAALTRTRRSLHGVAELVLAGPQYRESGVIRLRISPGGFRTVAAPELRVEAGHVVAAGVRVPIAAATPRLLAAAVGVDAGAPAGLYADGSGVGLDEELELDAAAAVRIASAYAMGDEALRLLAPGDDPVLWPEHFDVGLRVGEINYGVSPGDGYLAEPYAYVGVDPVPDDPYWNAPFGRVRPTDHFDRPDALYEFFIEGRDRFTG